MCGSEQTAGLPLGKLGLSGPATHWTNMTAAHNEVIDLLPPPDRQRLIATCKRVKLSFADVLLPYGRPIGHVYFPIQATVVLTVPMDEHPGVGVGIVGREGVIGAQVALGAIPSAVEALVQGPGEAWRVETPLFHQAMSASVALQKVVNLRNAVLIAETTLAASCFCFHPLAPRLARWLLMSADRAADIPGIQVTQEFLARVLAVRRVGVTAAAQDLRCRGLIDYERGEVFVRDRPGLEAAACSCYSRSRKHTTLTWPGMKSVTDSSMQCMR